MRRNEIPLNLASFISNFGDGMHTLAIGQILYQRTGQVTSFGLVISLNYLIGIVCQIYAGHLADRFVRSRLVKYGDFARGILVLGLAVLVAFSRPMIELIIISLLIKICTQLYRPAYQAMISISIEPERLSAFNSNNVACFQGGQLLGMAFFGLLFRLGPAMVFVADASTFFVSGLIVHGLRTLAVTNSVKNRSSVVRSWIEAYHYVRQEKGLISLILVSASIFLIYPIQEMSVAPVNAIRFGNDKTWMAILNGMFSCGCIFTMLIVRFWKKAKEEKGAHLWMVAQALCFGFLWFFDSSKTVMTLAYFGMGLTSTMASIQLLNKVMKRSSNAFQGRVAGLRYLVISILIAVVIPLLTTMFARSLSLGLLVSSGVLLGFAGIATLTALCLNPCRFPKNTNQDNTDFIK